MKKFISAIIILYGAMSSNGYAALAPLQESIREINAVLNHPDFAKSLNENGAILMIQHKDNSYIIRTTHQQLVVDVIYQTQNRPGPQAFKLVFH
jgi:hypothetical protein